MFNTDFIVNVFRHAFEIHGQAFFFLQLEVFFLFSYYYCHGSLLNLCSTLYHYDAVYTVHIFCSVIFKFNVDYHYFFQNWGMGETFIYYIKENSSHIGLDTKVE